MQSSSAEIQAGDWVIVYSSRDQLASIYVTPGQEFQSRFGHFKHDAMINVRWGTKFPSSNGRGFVYLLKPTPELWTQALPHRTQILYLPDIAFITSFLDIKAGSKVIEAGTGSGSLSHSLVRTVGPKGRVYSFEFHEERFEKARDEFKHHGLDEIITIKHQDVYKSGFELVNEVDSVFLDLPAPWMAIDHAKASLRKDRQSRICCFSPCIEQVIRTVTALTEAGFADITMYETLVRAHDPAQIVNPDIGTAIERIKNVEEKKGRRRESQIKEAKRKRDIKERIAKGETLAEDEIEGTSAKRRRVDEADEDDGATPADSPDPGAATPVGLVKINTLKPSGLARGHTSFLTFAILLPLAPIGGATNGSEPPRVEPKDTAPIMDNVEPRSEHSIKEEAITADSSL